MHPPLTLLSWNMRKATKTSQAWEILLEAASGLALAHVTIGLSSDHDAITSSAGYKVRFVNAI